MAPGSRFCSASLRAALRPGHDSAFLDASGFSYISQQASRRVALHILITGATGMIGRKLTARLIDDGSLQGSGIDRFTLQDVVPFPAETLRAGAKPSVYVAAGDCTARLATG